MRQVDRDKLGVYTRAIMAQIDVILYEREQSGKAITLGRLIRYNIDLLSVGLWRHSIAAKAKGPKNRHEHGIPLSVVINSLIEHREDPEMCERIIEKAALSVSKITVEEDRRLNSLKLRSRMPEGWTVLGCASRRYEAAGIRFDDEE